MIATTYSFALPTRIFFGVGIVRNAGEEEALGARDMMLVADNGVIGAGLTTHVRNTSDAGRSHGETSSFICSRKRTETPARISSHVSSSGISRAS
jgi:alcohol dehydrogenase class IV